VRYLVPVRRLSRREPQPTLDPVDESVLEVVPTAPFSGIADYVVRSPYLVARNWHPLSRTLADSDLLWLRLPASNAAVALAAARRARVPYFCWRAGSVREVVAAQARPLPLRWAAGAVGAAYDAIGDRAARGGPQVRLDAEMFSSIVSEDDVAVTRRRRGLPAGPPWILIWAGRMAAEKGLPELIEAFEIVLAAGHDARLVLVGDGPQRAQVEAAARRLPRGRVDLIGHVGDRRAYMDLLRSAHVLVHPSRAEGVPKVLVEAMAAGAPVVAADVGAVGQVLGGGSRGRLVPPGNAVALADAVARLLDDATARSELAASGLRWAAEHTAEAQASRLVEWLRQQFPRLPWQSDDEPS
jgi:glycosyltransferase involved in cell wall biosynthesis